MKLFSNSSSRTQRLPIGYIEKDPTAVHIVREGKLTRKVYVQIVGLVPQIVQSQVIIGQNY